jgi:hypothetical protein
MSSDVNRRALLGTVVTVGTSAASGCVNRLLPPDTSTKLGLLAIENYDTENGHEFDLRVERDGDIVHRSSHSVKKTVLPHISGFVLECPWEFVDGEYTVSARIDNGEWLNQPLAAPFDTVPDCVISVIRYGSLRSESIENPPLAIEVEDDCHVIAANDGGCRAYQSAVETND